MVDQISGVTRRINRESTSGKTVRILPLTNHSGLVYWTTLWFLIKLCCYLSESLILLLSFLELVSHSKRKSTHDLPSCHIQAILFHQVQLCLHCTCSFPRPQGQSVFLGAVILVCPSKSVHFILLRIRLRYSSSSSCLPLTYFSLPVGV